MQIEKRKKIHQLEDCGLPSSSHGRILADETAMLKILQYGAESASGGKLHGLLNFMTCHSAATRPQSLHDFDIILRISEQGSIKIVELIMQFSVLSEQQ